MKRLKVSGAVLAAGAMLGAHMTAQAQGLPFLPGDLVVSRVGAGGATAATSAATAVFLDEYSTTGTLVQTIALPTAAAGANNPFTNSGSATSEGALTLSGNGQYLTLGGYNAAVGTLTVASTTTAAAPRVVARVDAFGNVDTTTSLSDAYSGNNIRAAVTTDGTTIYTAGVGTAPANGVRQTTTGSTTSTGFTGNPANVRVINIFGGQIYTSTAGSTSMTNPYAAGIYALGSTTPLVATGTASSPYDFVFTNASTVFVADDRVTASGGLQEYTNTGGGFALAQTFNLSGATAGSFAGMRGLTATADGSTLYAVSTDNRIVSFSTVSDVFSTVVTGTANANFRGLDFAPAGAAPVPEAGTVLSLSMGLVVLGGVGLRSRRTSKTMNAAPAKR